MNDIIDLTGGDSKRPRDEENKREKSRKKQKKKQEKNELEAEIQSLINQLAKNENKDLELHKKLTHDLAEKFKFIINEIPDIEHMSWHVFNKVLDFENGMMTTKDGWGYCKDYWLMDAVILAVSHGVENKMADLEKQWKEKERKTGKSHAELVQEGKVNSKSFEAANAFYEIMTMIPLAMARCVKKPCQYEGLKSAGACIDDHPETRWAVTLDYYVESPTGDMPVLEYGYNMEWSYGLPSRLQSKEGWNLLIAPTAEYDFPHRDEKSEDILPQLIFSVTK